MLTRRKASKKAREHKITSTWRTPSKAALEQQSANSNEEKSVNHRNMKRLSISEILNSLNQDLLKKETSPEVDSELASIINSMPKDGLSEEN